MKLERRKSSRRNVSLLNISSMLSLKNLNQIAKGGTICNASVTGFLILVNREDLVPKKLRQSLNIDSLLGDHIQILIDSMELEMTGIITRTRLVGKKGFEIAIDFSEDSPKYWRECLLDLLPEPGEFK